MRVGLMVDSACDLPPEFIRKNDIFILPLTAIINGQTYVDDHDPATTAEFYDRGLLLKGHHAETEAFSAEAIQKLFLEKVVTAYDMAFCETVDRSRSEIFDNATLAMNQVMARYQPIREKAGRSGPFSMRVVDTGQVFAGQGLMAAHTLRLINQKLSKNALRHQVETFADNIYTCSIPRDLHYIRERARRRNVKSISAVSAFLGKTLNITPIVWGHGADGTAVAKTRSFDAAVEKVLDYAVRRVEAGLLTPYVSLSCGMSSAEIEQLPGLARLREACQRHKVELLLCQMGITSSIYLGPGSVCLALAAEDHGFED
ncbi:DegV family protein [Marinobacter sp. M1N3S26]|uniref:DegV family protein n=1 Tax=Marinobacter sp. M1N3S26 TaxID=3382299 RepID=UPI00387B4832